MKTRFTVIYFAFLSIAGCGGPQTAEEEASAEQSLGARGAAATGQKSGGEVKPMSCEEAKAVGNYTVSILANQEATHDGYEEAMLLDPQGFVCQGSGENVFIVHDGVLHTPDLAGGALEGITRATIIEFANELSIPVVERRITRDEIYIADEAFFTGTAAEVTPIRELDGRVIGAGKAGPVTKKLQKAFFDVVTGKDRRHRHWLTPVPMKKGKA